MLTEKIISLVLDDSEVEEFFLIKFVNTLFNLTFFTEKVVSAPY